MSMIRCHNTLYLNVGCEERPMPLSSLASCFILFSSLVFSLASILGGNLLSLNNSYKKYAVIDLFMIHSRNTYPEYLNEQLVELW